MLKKSLILSVLFGLGVYLNASNVTEEMCSKKGENFIYSGEERIEFKTYKGESENKLIVIVHGTWPAGTNILGRYAPFAESVAFQTDVTTVAIALPGYSNSSTNNFEALSHEGVKNLSANKDYILFLSQVIESLKEKYQADSLTYVGHSAGCSIGATMTGLKPGLINNLLCAGGNYDVHKKSDDKNLVSIVDVIDDVDKETKITLVYGTEDKISIPAVSTDFYEIAKKKDLNVTLVEVKGAEHLDLDMTTESVNALIELVEE